MILKMDFDLINLTNTFLGLLLALPLLFKFGSLGQKLRKFYEGVKPFWNIPGLISFLMAAINILERFFCNIPLFNGSNPQTIMALIIGLIMAFETIRKIDFLRKISAALRQFSQIFGVIALFVGLYPMIPFI